MLLVKTRIDVSSIHGIGLFANEFIPKGTVTWQYHEGLDLDLDKDTVDSLPETQKNVFLHYSYFDKERNKFIIPIDDLRFINHTKDNSKVNISSTPDQDVAARDINIGEELLCNYSLFDADYFDRIGIAPNLIK